MVIFDISHRVYLCGVLVEGRYLMEMNCIERNIHHIC